MPLGLLSDLLIDQDLILGFVAFLNEPLVLGLELRTFFLKIFEDH